LGIALRASIPSQFGEEDPGLDATALGGGLEDDEGVEGEVSEWARQRRV
jgi:hypothetical protein